MSAPSLNLPSFRLAFESQIASLPPEVQTVHRSTFNALTDIYQGFDALNSKVNALKSSAKTAATSTSTNVTSNSETIIQEVAPTIGFVNDQTGQTSYTTGQSDYGKMIVFNDASPIAVTLSVTSSIPGINLPYFTSILNLGSSAITVTPSTGTINGTATETIGAGEFSIIYFDGTNFFAEIPAASGSGVTQIIAGTDITISPPSGTGVVTINSTGGASGVSSLNALTGGLSLTSTGSTVTITPAGTNIDLEVSGAVSGVSSLNTLTGALSIVAGTGISVTPSGSDITIANTVSGGYPNVVDSALSTTPISITHTYTSPALPIGLYRISAYMVCTAATGAPDVVGILNFTDSYGAQTNEVVAFFEASAGEFSQGSAIFYNAIASFTPTLVFTVTGTISYIIQGIVLERLA